MTIVSRSLGPLLGFLLFSAIAAPAAAETVISKSISYFTITGSTAEELDAALNRHGPLGKSTGTRHPGITRIKFGGAVTYLEQDGRCSVSAAKVTLSTQLVLPRWKYRKKASKQLSMIWDTLAADIKRHEERHAEIARSHARDMEQRFLAVRSNRSCAVVQAAVAAASQAAIEDHNRDQARFDRNEAASFETRMRRLLNFRLKSQSAR